MTKINKKGFTMVELLVVISIVGFIMTAAMYLVNSARIKARDTKRLSDMSILEKAFKLYYEDNGYYPRPITAYACNDQCFQCQSGTYVKISSFLSTKYISKIPDDPNNNDDNTTGCYWYLHRLDNGPTSGQGFMIIMNPEDNNILKNDLNCFSPINTYYSRGENCK